MTNSYPAHHPSSQPVIQLVGEPVTQISRYLENQICSHPVIQPLNIQPSRNLDIQIFSHPAIQIFTHSVDCRYLTTSTSRHLTHPVSQPTNHLLSHYLATELVIQIAKYSVTSRSHLGGLHLVSQPIIHLNI